VQFLSVIIHAVFRKEQIVVAVRVVAWQAKFLQGSIENNSVFQQEDLEILEINKGPLWVYSIIQIYTNLHRTIRIYKTIARSSP
jgi:hypothetical protein